MTDYKLVPVEPTEAMIKAMAYRKVRSAIESGALTRPTFCSRCQAADTKEKSGRHTIQAHHHRGYNHPLDVEWLCPKCHRKETPLPAKIGAPCYGQRNGDARLTADKVREIRVFPHGAWTTAKSFGVSKKAIQNIRRGVTWAHLE